MLEPLIKTIEVPCNQQLAFTVFLEMSTWWPTNRFATSVMRGSSVSTIRVDAREGGTIVEVGADDREHLWGRIRVYQPYDYLNIDFHIPHPSEQNPGFTTLEVRFAVLSEQRTRVELKQSNWESLGDVAGMAQGGYRHGWTLIFEGAFRAACERSTGEKRPAHSAEVSRS